MGQAFVQKLQEWMGERTHTECAELLDIPVATFRKYIYGSRTPTPLGLVELERRMDAITNDGKAKKANGGAAKTAKGV